MLLPIVCVTTLRSSFLSLSLCLLAPSQLFIFSLHLLPIIIDTDASFTPSDICLSISHSILRTSLYYNSFICFSHRCAIFCVRSSS